MTRLIPLDEATDKAASGSKAANLAALMGLGIRVPEGLVVPVPEFSAHAAERAPDELPGELLEELYGFAGPVEPVAVRSSGIAEDLAGASFAGMYETILDVRGREALAGAVLRCWASAHDPRVSLYQRRQGQTAAPMAVLVQRMLRVESAGVAFTANPVTGAHDEVVISAVPAVGEELVSGERPAEEWVVRGEAATRVRAPVEALTSTQALEVADMAKRIEDHFGVPQDVEWAFEDGVLHFLQARPISALPEPVEWTPPDANLMWMRNFRIGEWLPEPVTPLFVSLILPSMESAMDGAGAALVGQGARLIGLHALVNGWCFYAPTGVASAAGHDGARARWSGLAAAPEGDGRGSMAAMVNLDLAVRWAVDDEEKRWREERIPRYLGTSSGAPPSSTISVRGSWLSSYPTWRASQGRCSGRCKPWAVSRGRRKDSWPSSTTSTCGQTSVGRTNPSWEAFGPPRPPLRTQSSPWTRQAQRWVS